MTHIPVLLSEVVKYLIVDKSGVYLDATVGEGGHAKAILSLLDQRGKLICADRDDQALKNAKINLAEFAAKVTFRKLRFSRIAEYLKESDIQAMDGFLFDLGISSSQIDNSERGFSYTMDGPLDMRMDQSQTKTASDVINSYSRENLIEIFFKYGQEKQSKTIAQAIAIARKKSQITTTGQLKDIVESKINPKYRIKSLARIFQALRIEVNQELEELKQGLKTAMEFLKPNGRLCVIAYHSLEDGIVKNQFRQFSRPCNCPPYFPTCGCGQKKMLDIMTKKPITPSVEEVKTNSRSRSAKLRVAVKVG